MRLSPSDLSNHAYCPYSWKNKINTPVSFRRFNVFETCVIRSILSAEKHCLLYNLDIDNKKILRKWDNIWWTEAAKNNILPKEAENLSIRAAMLFNSYSKQDFIDYLIPTVGINLYSEYYTDNSILISQADILKVDLNNNKRNTIIYTFGNKRLDEKELYSSPFVWSTIYPFYLNKGEQIKCTYIGILDKKEEIYTSSCYFREEDIKKVKKYIDYFIRGIKNNIDFMNLSNCKECKKCRNFKL